MRPTDRRGRLRASLLCAALAVCLALPAGASAVTPGGGTAQVTIAQAVHVTAKVVAVVDVSFTCDPFLIFDWETGTMEESTVGHVADGGVTLTQASGKSIAMGGASFDNHTVVCDGVTVQRLPMVIMATTLPWKSGAAVASARIQIYSDGFETRDIGESGPVVVKLGK